MNNIVTLDVRGTIFKTERSTLLRQPEGYRNCFTEGCVPNRTMQRKIEESRGEVFLNLDPEYFRAFLNWMAHGVLLTEGLNEVLLKATAQELGLNWPLEPVE